MSVLVVIPARGGSKAIPNKNLVNLGGKPLVAHAVEQAMSALAGWSQAKVAVSTDSPEIQAIAVGAGAACPTLRPSKLAGDDVPSLPVVQHAVSDAEASAGIVFDVVVLIQATAPLWRREDLLACLSALESSLDWASAVLVTPVQTHPFKMKRLLDDGRLINLVDQGFEDMRPRQGLPPVYRRAGSVYASRREVVMEQGSLVGDPCLGVVVPPETAVDIDSPLDLALARLLHRTSDSG